MHMPVGISIDCLILCSPIEFLFFLYIRFYFIFLYFWNNLYKMVLFSFRLIKEKQNDIVELCWLVDFSIVLHERYFFFILCTRFLILIPAVYRIHMEVKYSFLVRFNKNWSLFRIFFARFLFFFKQHFPFFLIFKIIINHK